MDPIKSPREEAKQVAMIEERAFCKEELGNKLNLISW
jgi:hypothetical protein